MEFKFNMAQAHLLFSSCGFFFTIYLTKNNYQKFDWLLSNFVELYGRSSKIFFALLALLVRYSIWRSKWILLRIKVFSYFGPWIFQSLQNELRPGQKLSLSKIDLKLDLNETQLEIIVDLTIRLFVKFQRFET